MATGQGSLPQFYPVKGLRLGVACAGIKKPGRRDLVVMELAEGAQVAGVFTRNRFCAAPVVVTRQHLAVAATRYLLINTGNANAGNGNQGIEDALTCCQTLAEQAGVAAQAVLPFSTGVIGEALPVGKIQAGLPDALASLSEDHWEDAAYGIMTTDTRPKGASRSLKIDGHPVVISGISKGAGMICPNMATMLGFIATDAAVEPKALQRLASELADRSFNRITIDGDTSTNDACMLIATGGNGMPLITEDSEAYAALRLALEDVFVNLAHAIIRDGEGATKFVTIDVEQAASRDEARAVAYTVAHSPLVKTALFASDPNWGRILAAVGRAGIDDLDVSGIHIYLGEVCIVENGGRAADYTEERGQAAMEAEDISIRILLGRGDTRETVWTTDFSHEYVTINAEYRT